MQNILDISSPGKLITTKANLTLNDIHLVPRVVSILSSRNEIKVNCKFLRNSVLTTPIIAAPMLDVCNWEVSEEMFKNGAFGIIHRFSSIESQVSEYKRGILYPDVSASRGCAVGITGDYLERFQALYEAGCRIFCLDVANGANTEVGNALEKLCKYYDAEFIVGNVASKECFSYLEQFDNVKAIRIGIGNGAGCTTTDATGISHGLASCILECSSIRKKALIIADGGIKGPADFCKCLALGADLIMLGSVLANTIESPAKIEYREGNPYKVYRGSASAEVQKEYRNIPRYIEGTTRYLPYSKKSVAEVLNFFMDGLKSSMSYFNARTLEEYRKNVTYVC